MTEKRFTVPSKYSLSHSKIQCDGEPLTNNELVRILNTNEGAFLENFNLKKENEQLKKEIKYLQSELHNATYDVRKMTLKEVKDEIEKLERWE